jgi:hypothetical protein
VIGRISIFRTVLGATLNRAAIAVRLSRPLLTSIKIAFALSGK